jgi:hypothetical protein
MTLTLTTIGITTLLSVGVFYLGLRLGLKVGSRSREPLYDDSVEIEQTHQE